MRPINEAWLAGRGLRVKRSHPRAGLMFAPDNGFGVIYYPCIGIMAVKLKIEAIYSPLIDVGLAKKRTVAIDVVAPRVIRIKCL